MRLAIAAPLLAPLLVLSPLPDPVRMPAAVRAQPAPRPAATPVMPRLVIGAPGRCELTVNNQPRSCTSGLVYVLHTNGSVLVSVQAGQGVTLGFEANGDRQPRPEQYVMQLVRMHTSLPNSTAAKTVTGSCEIAVSTDGQIWHRATCRATDGNGMLTVMNFTGSGQPVAVARPGKEGAPAGRAQGAPGGGSGTSPGTSPGASGGASDGAAGGSRRALPLKN